MTQTITTNLKATPLLGLHKELGAKLVPFVGWNMPIQFAGVLSEHICVRERVGLFDVSHMGEIEVKGKDAKKFLQFLLSNNVEKMFDGSILYSLMCYETGGVVDDLLAYRFSENHYFLCVNASNSDKDYDWIARHASSFNVNIKNTSSETSQLALQGPDAKNVLQSLCGISLDDLSYYNFRKGMVNNVESLISRTGYTGEDGFELYLSPEKVSEVFRSLMEQGRSYGIQPIGLGARDTLRIEMGYPLYGNEIDNNPTPLDAGLGWVIKFDKGEFLGRGSLLKQKEQGSPRRKLVGLKLLTRGVPRAHYQVFKNGESVGEVTSGTFSPTLNTGVGLCYVSSEYSDIGNHLDVKIRDQLVATEVIQLPFVPSHVKKQ
ncbi:MAG: glycine cleavage system aminomethyltransferase GcvT [Nitrospinales bacterium]|nr:glycine cleavage system aminomethyltransferase GcvT [Nitrospinales bacterium]